MSFRILVVDDDPTARALLERNLGRALPGSIVELAQDGAEALERLLDPSMPLPNVVLLDLNMPGMSGVELLAVLRGRPALAELTVAALHGDDSMWLWGADGPGLAIDKWASPAQLRAELEAVEIGFQRAS